MKFLLDFKNTAQDADINSYLNTNGCTVLKSWSFFDKIYLVECASTPPASELLDHIVDDTASTITPHDVIPVNQHFGSHSDPNAEKIVANNTDPKDWWKTFTYANPDFDSATTSFSRLGNNINVYLLDSGVETSHPEFVDANITQLYSIVGNFDDHSGHGTALASVIVGKTCGITNANLKVVKVFEENHDTLQSELLNALDAVANDHQDGQLSILNASWTINKNEWVEQKLRLLMSEGIYVICAAGNNGTPIENVTPASMPDVLTVGAYNKNLQPCDFSNYTGGSLTSLNESQTNHGALDGWAPGEEIWCAGLNGQYGNVAGTSIATAIASAVAVLNWYHLLNPEGVTAPLYSNLSVDHIFSGYLSVMGRTGLLEFNDPKYNDSENKIATIMDKALIQEPQQSDEIFSYVKINDPMKILGKLYVPALTKSIEIIDPLPSSWVLQHEGILVGAVTSDMNLGPAAGEISVLRQYKYKRTNIDDTVEDCVLNIYVLDETADMNSIPQDEPVNLILQAAYCQNGAAQVCSGGPLTGQCFSSCGGMLSCCYFEYPKGSKDICACTYLGP